MKCVYLLTPTTYNIAHNPVEFVQSESLKPWTMYFDGAAYEFRLFEKLEATASREEAFLFVEVRLNDFEARRLVNAYLEADVHIHYVETPLPRQT